MNVLIINTGSSSIKYQLMHMPSENVLCAGMVDRIGLENANLKYIKKNQKKKIRCHKIMILEKQL